MLVTKSSNGAESSLDLEKDDRLAFESLMADLSARFINRPADEVDKAIEGAQRELCETLGLDRSSLFQRKEDGSEELLLTHLFQRPGIPTPAVNRRASANPCASSGILEDGESSSYLKIDGKNSFPFVYEQLRNRQTIMIPNVMGLEAVTDKERLLHYGTKSSVIIPLFLGNDWLGCLTFASLIETREWSEKLVKRLQFVADVFTSALARKRAEEVLARSYAEIKQLKERLRAESEYLRSEIKVSQAHGEIIGRSEGLKKVLQQIEQVAPVDCAVLISGETGTGKELIAQEIHRLSARRDRLMVLVNCAALPSALVESELFGRERGAYTGALTSQVGHFEVADDSTIFLDEVGELSMEVQAKLLRVLQQGEFQRLGSPKIHKVDARVIAATNRDLAADVRKGRFREDLYYRLKVFPIEIPPLRARVDDIPLLVFAFMEGFSARMGKKITKVPRKAMEALQKHSWPGNIRELRNVIEHSVILSSGDTLKLSFLGDTPTREVQAVTLAEAEREHILKTLESTSWRIKGPHGAARRLDLQPSTLYSRMQKLGIPHRRQKDQLGGGQ